MSSQQELREKVTNQIVAALRSGNVPFWRRPWAQSENAGVPTNAISGKPYRGINNLLTSLAAMQKGYDSKWWATYNQWRSIGGQVRRHEKGQTIILYKPVRKVTINDHGEEKVDSFPIMRAWTVFNIGQVAGDAVEKYRAVTPTSSEPRFVDYEPAEKVVAATEADIRFVGDRAFYSINDDFIQLPPKAAFEKANEFYGTLAHELIHWTGHESRLHRINKLARFGDESYAVEELVADLGQAMLLAEVGVPQSDDLRNVTAYLAHWLNVLERDHSAIFVASSSASKAVDLVLSFSRPKEEENQEDQSALVGGAV